MAITLRRRDPWSMLYNMPSLMDEDWFDSSMQDQGLSMYETDDDVVIEANVAGVPADQVDISIEGGTVTIRAEFEEDEEKKKKVEYRRRRAAKYLYTVSLPTSVDSQKANAEVTNGIVYLTLPKREEAKPQQIKVKSS